MTKAQRLEAMIEATGLDNELFIEFHPGSGWYLTFTEPRWFGDEGDCLGTDFASAEVSLSVILADQQIDKRRAVPHLRAQLFELATKRVRDEQVKTNLTTALSKMVYEEMSYWHVKCSTTNGARAFRILFGGAS